MYYPAYRCTVAHSTLFNPFISVESVVTSSVWSFSVHSLFFSVSFIFVSILTISFLLLALGLVCSFCGSLTYKVIKLGCLPLAGSGRWAESTAIFHPRLSGKSQAFSRLQGSGAVPPDRFHQCSNCLGVGTGSRCCLLYSLPRIPKSAFLTRFQVMPTLPVHCGHTGPGREAARGWDRARG